jgi:hypothetical protein
MASDLKTYLVRCKLKGQLLAEYEFKVPVPMDSSKSRPPTREHLVSEAKTNLTNQGLATPPYEGIEFEVVPPR